MTGAPQAAVPSRRHLGTRTFALLTLGYFAVALYGSLVPFSYQPLSWEESFARWHQVVQLPLGVDSRTDFATNVLLFIPLGFLLTGTFAVGRSRLASVLSAVPVVALCAALSAAIEFTQLWFPPRVSSLNDVLAETIGAVIGATTWVIAGQRLTDYARSVWVAWGPENLAVKWLPAYLFLLVLIHVMPLDLTISPAELHQKWKEGRVILIPFTTDYGGWGRGFLKNAWNMAYFFPLGLFLSLWPGRPFRSGLPVLAVGLLAAAGVEFLQLFVWTRYCDATDILTGGAAVWLGWFALEAWKGWRAKAAGRNPPAWAGLVRPCLFLTWLLAVVVVNWFPFDVISGYETAMGAKEWVLSQDGRSVRSPDQGEELPVRTVGPFVVLADAGVVRRRFLLTPLVPMVDLQSGADYEAFDQVVRKTLLFLPLGALLVPSPLPLSLRRAGGRGEGAAKGRTGVWRALLVGLLLSCFFEAGQLFIPDRTCSTSDVLIETIGTVLGFVLFRRLLLLLGSQAAAEPSVAALSGQRARRPVGLGVFVTDD
jgi:glycopeptide antibiotics resistance protein